MSIKLDRKGALEQIYEQTASKVVDSAMILSYATRRRRAVLFSVFLLFTVIILINRGGPLTKIYRSVDLTEEPCIKHLAKFNQRPFNWPTFIPFLWKDSDEIIDRVRKLQEFEKCVIQKGAVELEAMDDIQRKLFPYLNFEAAMNDKLNFWPKWTRWDRSAYSASMPHFSLLDNSFTHVESVKYNPKTSFWENWYTSMMQANSKGIVISIGDGQVADTIRLIHVLRYLDNTLPIQLVHKGDLSSAKVEELFKAARERRSDGSPPQELWIVDVKNLLNPAMIHEFKRFSNKWLALLFCSFEKPILLDADTVPFTKLEEYYDTDQFKKYGTVFFKDRTLTAHMLNRGQRRTLKRIFDGLLTSSDRQSSADSYYGIQDPIVQKALERMLKKRQKHIMESGLVAYDKKKHLFGLLTSLALQFSPLNEYFHGEKEWFWISQLIRGVPFSFHPVEASSVGRIEKTSEDEFRVCSVQLSHTEQDGSILWLNGGLRTCKFDNWDWEYENKPSLSSVFSSAEDLRKVYQSPVVLEAVILPEAEIRPWAVTDFCMRYHYCTYYKENGPGKLILFNEAKKRKYQKIVETWNR